MLCVSNCYEPSYNLIKMDMLLKTEWDNTIQKAIEQYYLYGERSNKKVAVIHSHLGKLIQNELGSMYCIKCLPDKEETVIGQYNSKAVDICIKDLDGNVKGVVSVKFIMSNYKQNSNNYFESLTGELHNLSPNYYALLESIYENSTEVGTIQKKISDLLTSSYARWVVLITFDEIPYFDKEHNIVRYEHMNESDRYSVLVNNGLLDAYTIIKCSNGKLLCHPSHKKKGSVENFQTNIPDVEKFQNDLRMFCSLVSRKSSIMSAPVKTKGVVFTGNDICDFMTRFVEVKDDKPINILEPSCGEGAFLKSLVSSLPANKVSIHGNDIDKDFINTCKNNFENRVNLTNEDFVNLSKTNKYDCIIGNPPYVRIQNLPDEQVKQLKAEYPKYLTGNFDLYMYFILKCIDMLTDDGKLIFIVPNSLLYNKSCFKLKQYLFDSGLVEYIIDFKENKMFENYNTYTCIIVLNKKYRDKRISYFVNDKMNDDYKNVMYDNKTEIQNSLLKFIDVRNGIATLADKVFIFHPIGEDDHVYMLKNGFEIEKEVCKTIFKVSKKKEMVIIYPYDDNGKVIAEDVMKDKYPKCYEYLVHHKDALNKRDKGKKKYEAWYAYGRRQSITTYDGTRLFIPTLVSNIKDNMIFNESSLFYSGLWIDIKDVYKNKLSVDDVCETLLAVEKDILRKSNVKSHGWYSLSKSSFDVECSMEVTS